MQIIGQNEQEQQQRRKIQKLGPSRQPKILSLAQRPGNKDRQHGDEQHREIVEIPQPALGIHVINGKFDGAQQDPQHHQHRDCQQIAPHLRLHDAHPDGVAPRAEQKHIDPASQVVDSRRMKNLPAGVAEPHGKRNERQHAQRIQNALFCRFAHAACLPISAHPY